MTAERWLRIEELFAELADRPPAERCARLDEAAAGDPELRAEVERLLIADGGGGAAGTFIEQAIAAGARAFGASEVGRRIGPYRLERELGRGGTSTVYLAVRDDREFERQVAIKLIRRGMDSEEILARFRDERQILARLDHPYIARLFDGGTTEDGLPYFVLERVEGLPIDEYCDRRRLSVTDRLRLFCQVCEAAHTAHQNLVIHRDLKPSNVLVTAEGIPKLLDFGIAKLLDPELSGEPTIHAARLLTPAYASPEQIAGRPVTTASDIYSLGVLLYWLLTGQRPYRGARQPGSDLARVIAEEEPEPPSQAVQGQESRRLRGDLDNILGKALRKEPERRYGSVEQLAEDIRRHLAGHPVLARPDTLRYRLGKFAGRHRWGVLAATAALAGGLVFTATLKLQAGHLAHERDRANQVSELLVDLFHLADPTGTRGSTITAREILDHGAERVRRLDGQPETQAMLYETLADLYDDLALYREAAAQLRQALALRQRIHPGDSAETASTLDALGRALAQGSDFEAALPQFKAALAMRRRLFGEVHVDVARSLNNLALVQHDLGDYAAAEPLYRQAIALDRRLNRHAHRYSLGNLSLLLQDRGDYRGAEALLRQRLALVRQEEGEESEDMADSLDRLGLVRVAQDDFAAGERYLRTALAIRRRLLGPEDREVARSLTNLGMALRERGDLAGAAPLLESGLALRLRVLGGEHAETAESLRELAALRAAEGRSAEAEQLYRRSLVAYGRSLPPRHPLAGLTRLGLAALLAGEGRCAEAEPLFAAALAQVPPDDWRVAGPAAARRQCRETESQKSSRR
jgi:serine/threonine-protein kinase